MGIVNTYAERVWRQFRNKGILVDSNLLLLLLVGGFDINIIEQAAFKRTAQYVVEDYQLLLKLLSSFNRAVTTAHVLTEVSNLAGQLAGVQKEACFSDFAKILGRFEEVDVPSFDAARQSYFPAVGLTDSVLIHLAPEFLVVTDDLRFASRVAAVGYSVLNLNNFRQEQWLA